jgi:butyryl-CoA dehydrogenase
MNFQLTEIQTAFQQTVREFAENEMAPYAAEWDEKHFYPVDTLKKAASLGLAGICVDEKWSGSGLTRSDSILIFEELAAACPSTAAWLSVHNMTASLISQHADDSLKQKWLPALCSLQMLASYCLTEPESGSDAASLKTSAKREGDFYVLNGTKAFITGGSVSDIYVCMARTGAPGPKGISCFLIEKDTPGLSFGKQEHKLGWHSQPTCMVFLENCRIPVSHLIGQEGEGFRIALSALNGGRLNIAACSIGGARTCLALAKKHMGDRRQFGKKLNEFEALQFRYADMVTDLDASRLMVQRAADALDRQDPDAPLYCAMAKKLATDTGFRVSNEVLQIFGGYGYTRDYAIERFFRDLRVHTILEGTNEIMRLIIARQTLESP